MLVVAALASEVKSASGGPGVVVVLPLSEPVKRSEQAQLVGKTK